MSTTTIQRPANVPANAKPKRMRRDSWDANSTITVWVAPADGVWADTQTTVWAANGTLLGDVRNWVGSLDRKIAGTRLISPGKRRTLWAPVVDGKPQYWREHTSAAAAIRHLLPR